MVTTNLYNTKYYFLRRINMKYSNFLDVVLLDRLSNVGKRAQMKLLLSKFLKIIPRMLDRGKLKLVDFFYYLYMYI